MRDTKAYDPVLTRVPDQVQLAWCHRIEDTGRQSSVEDRQNMVKAGMRNYIMQNYKGHVVIGFAEISTREAADMIARGVMVHPHGGFYIMHRLMTDEEFFRLEDTRLDVKAIIDVKRLPA